MYVVNHMLYVCCQSHVVCMLSIACCMYVVNRMLCVCCQSHVVCMLSITCCMYVVNRMLCVCCQSHVVCMLSITCCMYVVNRMLYVCCQSHVVCMLSIAVLYILCAGVFIRDLIFFNDGNNKKLKNGLINFSKLRTMVLKVHMPTTVHCTISLMYSTSCYFFTCTHAGLYLEFL